MSIKKISLAVKKLLRNKKSIDMLFYSIVKF